MNERPRVTVTIDREGNAKVETTGFAGPACIQATAQLEAALGVKTQEVLTDDYYAPPQSQEQSLDQAQ